MSKLKGIRALLNHVLKENNKSFMQGPIGKNIKRASMVERFVLPEGGTLLDDQQKGLHDIEVPRLPFSEITVEFEIMYGGTTNGVVIYAQEVYESIVKELVERQNDDLSQINYDPERICIFISAFMEVSGADHKSAWIPLPVQAFVVSQKARVDGFSYKNEVNRHMPLIMYRVDLNMMNVAMSIFSLPDMKNAITIFKDTMARIGVTPVLELIEALACSNVKYKKTKETVSSVLRAMGKLPAMNDSYNVLTINVSNGETVDVTASGKGAHGRPREHLRRGHIRKYASGIKVWINQVIVNAGIGGKLMKDYEVVT